MAVFRQNLEFTTLQFKQLEALENLQDSLEDIFKVGKDVYKRVDTLPDTILQSAGVIVKALTDIGQHDSQEDAYYDSILDSFRDSNRLLEDASEDIQQILEEEHEESTRYRERIPGLFDDLKSSLKDFAKEQWKLAAESANTWSRMYNDTIKYIGTDKNESQQFRRDIVNIVDDLNAEVSILGDFGAKLDPQQVMDTMLAISNSTNISDVDTLKAITKPLILAQETTNLNTAELAQLGSRLYNRYSFSSTSLEKLVDNVRNMSEGQNVDENQVLGLMSKASIYYGNMFRGDEEKILEALTNIGADSSWLQSNNMSTELLEKVVMLLGEYESGYKPAHGELSKLIGNGEVIDELLRKFVSGEGGLGETLARYLATVDPNSLVSFPGLGSVEDLLAAQQAIAALDSGNGNPLENIMKSLEEENSATERLEDKYTSIGDQINNNLKGISSYLSSIQESLGIGLDDITLGISVLGNVLGSKGILGVLGGSSGASLASGAGILGSLIGPAGIVAGIVALGVVVDGISEAYKKVNEDKLASMGDLAKGEAKEGTEYYWESSLGDDGVSWELKSVDTSNFGEEELAKFHEVQSKNAEDYQSFLSKGTNLTGWGKAFDIVTRGMLTSNQKVYAYTLEDLANYNTDPKYQDMTNYYLSNGLLNTSSTRTIEGFLKNIDEYLDLYNEGKVAEVKKNGSPGATASLVSSYDVGTNYVDKDQLAYIHEGEEIVPKKYNPSANIEDIKKIVDSQDMSEELETIAIVLSDIKDYLEYWKKDEDRKSSIKTAKSSILGRTDSRSRLSNYYRDYEALSY